MTVILKFGGSSVSNVKRIIETSAIINEFAKLNEKIVVVVSAMYGHTDSLVSLYKETAKSNFSKHLREYDSVVSTGESLSASLTSIALCEKGLESQSLRGHQVPIITDSNHYSAKILDIGTDVINGMLVKGIIPVVTGFQGVTKAGAVTTLGRGGSDITAVALAYRLNAKCCYIYTDVDGVYTANPRQVKSAMKMNRLDFRDMLELSSFGSKVLHPRAVGIAYNANVKICVRSSFVQGEGSMVEKNIQGDLEGTIIRGIASLSGEVEISINCNSHKLSIHNICEAFNLQKIPIDIISTSLDGKDSYNLSISINKDYKEEAVALLENIQDKYKNTAGLLSIKYSSNISKVSIVGFGLSGISGIMYKIMQVIEDSSIILKAIYTSDTRITIVINDDQSELLVNSLHSKFIINNEID